MRLFLAVELPDSLKRELGKNFHNALKSCANRNEIKPVRPGNLHITLHFFGEQSPAIQDVVVRVLATFQFKSFLLTVKGLDFFIDKSGKVRVIFSIVESLELSSLALELKGVLSQIGFSEDKKPFLPHITLARLKRSQKEEKLCGIKQAFGKFNRNFRVNSFTLFGSELHTARPVYHREKIFILD